MTLNDFEHYKSQMYSIYLLPLSQSFKFHPILLYVQPFSVYKVVNNWKCTEWTQNDFEQITVKTTSYVVSTYSWGPNFGSFRSTRYEVAENRNKNQICTEWPQDDIEHFTVKSTWH